MDSSRQESCSLNYNDLDRIFKRIDKNGDGHVSLDELNSLVETIGVQLTRAELVSLVGKPCLDLNEFVMFYISISNRSDHQSPHQYEKSEDTGGEDDDLFKAFKVFDADGDGYISCEELQNALCKLGLWDESHGRLDCKKMIFVFDTNADGKLDFEEFKNMMLNATPS